MKRIVLLAALAASFGAPARAEFAVSSENTTAARVEALENGVAEAHYRLRVAQLYGRPPADLPGQPQPYERAQDSGGLVLRVDRLENQMRNLNGQIEQMQFQTRRLEEQLRKFQQDVDFRFQESAGRGGAHKPAPAPTPAPRERRTELEPEIAPIQTSLSGVAPAPIAASATPSATPGSHLRRGDAFDPSANPSAPGAPRQLGAVTTATVPASPQRLPGGPIDFEASPGRPLDLSPANAAAQPPAALGAPQPAAVIPAPVTAAPAPMAAPGTQVASIPAMGPRLDYEIAIGHFRAGQYEAAEKALGEFVARNPKDKLASEAIFFLGESYYQRGRHREAAEQYLKISTSHGRSAKAAEALLRLGQSLQALGAKEQRRPFWWRWLPV